MVDFLGIAYLGGKQLNALSRPHIVSSWTLSEALESPHVGAADGVLVCFCWDGMVFVRRRDIIVAC